MPVLKVVFIDTSCGGFPSWKPDRDRVLFSHVKVINKKLMSLKHVDCGFCLSVPLLKCWAVEKFKSRKVEKMIKCVLRISAPSEKLCTLS